MSRISLIATTEATMRIGLNGNYYVFSVRREPVAEVAVAIGRSAGSVYWSHLGVWALRVKRRADKAKLMSHFKRLGRVGEQMELAL